MPDSLWLNAKTRAFPYGLYKVENLVSVIVALAIFYAGYEIALEAIKGGGSSLQNLGQLPVEQSALLS